MCVQWSVVQWIFASFKHTTTQFYPMGTDNAMTWPFALYQTLNGKNGVS